MDTKKTQREKYLDPSTYIKHYNYGDGDPNINEKLLFEIPEERIYKVKEFLKKNVSDYKKDPQKITIFVLNSCGILRAVAMGNHMVTWPIYLGDLVRENNLFWWKIVCILDPDLTEENEKAYFRTFTKSTDWGYSGMPIFSMYTPTNSYNKHFPH